MPKEYKIIKVSEQEPRKWEGEHGTVYYIKVMLEGHEKPVEIGKKAKDALKAGDTVYGTVTESSYPTDKFKSEKVPFTPGGKSNYQPRDDAAIKAQMAVKASAHLWAHRDWTPDDVKGTAIYLYSLVDVVKDSAKPVEKVTVPDEVHNDFGDEPIDLSDIPF